MMTKYAYNMLFVCDFPFADAGGVGRVTETLAAEFVKRGHAVTYLSFSAGEECVSSGIRQLFAPGGRIILSNENATYLEQLIEELKIDIIINQGGVKTELIQLFAMVDRGQTKLLSVHHNSVAALQENYQHIITESYRGRWFSPLLSHPVMKPGLELYHRLKQGRYFKSALQQSDRLVLLSERFIPELSIYWGNQFCSDKVVGILNPAAFEVVEGAEENKENRLLYVGRLNYQQKRCDLLIELWKRISNDFPTWSFDVVGDGPVRKELEERAAGEGLDRIYFHGFQDPRPYLEKAKIFCMTSAYEGFGMVLVEAQAYGVVPIAFDCFSALPDIIETGQSGYILPKFDLGSYVEKMVVLMSDDAKRQAMARAGQATLHRFMPSAICEQWEELFSLLPGRERECL